MKDYNYIKVQEYILSEISDKKLKPGMKIQSERELSKLLNINRMSVKNAINKLVESKILYRIHGKGTFVTESLNHNGRMIIADKTPISLKMKNIILGKITYNDVLSFKLLYGCDKISKLFKHDKDFYELVRIRYSGDIAYSVEYCYIPFSKFKDAIRYDFSTSSLYDYMEYKKKLPVKFETHMSVVKNEEINSVLNISKGSKVFNIEFFGSTQNFELVEYTQSYILLTEVEFNYHIKRNEPMV